MCAPFACAPPVTTTPKSRSGWQLRWALSEGPQVCTQGPCCAAATLSEQHWQKPRGSAPRRAAREVACRLGSSIDQIASQKAQAPPWCVACGGSAGRCSGCTKVTVTSTAVGMGGREGARPSLEPRDSGQNPRLAMGKTTAFNLTVAYWSCPLSPATLECQEGLLCIGFHLSKPLDDRPELLYMLIYLTRPVVLTLREHAHGCAIICRFSSYRTSCPPAEKGTNKEKQMEPSRMPAARPRRKRRP